MEMETISVTVFAREVPSLEGSTRFVWTVMAMAPYGV